MASNYDIKLKRYNGADYDILHPETTVDQVTGSWPTNRLSGQITQAQITPGATYATGTVTLTTSWSQYNTQTVSAPGVDSGSVLFVSPDPSSYPDYVECNIRCTGQSSNALTFTCDDIPSSSLSVQYVILR